MNENRDERLRAAVDGIEPQSGARERMMQNIKNKMAEQTGQDSEPQRQSGGRTRAFNKVIKAALPIAACLVIAVLSMMKLLPMFGGSADNPDDIELSNPFITVESAKEFEKIGLYLDAPEQAEDVSYAIIDGEQADISFTYEGHAYNFRASKQNGDFSGLCGDVISEEKVDASADATLTLIRSGDDLFYKLTWTDGKVHYILTNTDGAGTEAVEALYQKIR